jgi:hypothetical protein
MTDRDRLIEENAKAIRGDRPRRKKGEKPPYGKRATPSPRPPIPPNPIELALRRARAHQPRIEPESNVAPGEGVEEWRA